MMGNKCLFSCRHEGFYYILLLYLFSVLILPVNIKAQTEAEATKAPVMKPKPEGVYCLMPFQTAINSSTLATMEQDPIWTMPNINGIAVRCSWSAIEPGDGTFNFSLFDEAIQLARQYGKNVSFSVTPGSFSPQWLYNEGAQTFMFTLSTGQTGVMPLPWDPTFQQKWFVLIKQLGQRYNNDPELTYMTMGGLGQQVETSFVQAPTDIQTFDAMNGQVKWLDAGKAIEAQYVLYFPTTRVLYAIDTPTPDTQGAQTMTELVNDCARSTPQQFGIRSDGLRPDYDETGATGLLLSQYANRLTTGFQMSLPAGSQSLSLWFSVAEQMQVNFVEVYEGDCENPDQAAALQQGNSAL
jgi:hypothetical protein